MIQCVLIGILVEVLYERGARKHLFSCYRWTSKRAKDVVVPVKEFVIKPMREKILLKALEFS
jgi:hypothetical protein